jgi:hypothetical protein
MTTPGRVHLFVLALLAAGLLPGCGDGAGASAPAAVRAGLSAAECGIEVVGLGLSAGGYMLDFRYRVTDPVKAAPLLDGRSPARLTDQATGAVLAVPTSPKVGALRQTTREAEAGRVYFMLFANPGAAVKAGARMTIDIADFSAADLVVR